MTATAAATLVAIGQRATQVGLALRGACHPLPDELATMLPGVPAGTIVLLGFTGSVQWPRFVASVEARDGLAHPLDRWSERVVGGLAVEFGAHAVYPSGTPTLPFQQLAMRCESVYPSPIGLLIHPRWGLWHAYRGALILPDRLALPPRPPEPSPCATCAGRPCLAGCPVGAFNATGFDVKGCVAHVTTPAGNACVERGCLAREACPIGTEHRYVPAQMRFHLQAFVRAVRN
jgi:hypothetical protein